MIDYNLRYDYIDRDTAEANFYLVPRPEGHTIRIIDNSDGTASITIKIEKEQNVKS